MEADWFLCTAASDSVLSSFSISTWFGCSKSVSQQVVEQTSAAQLKPCTYKRRQQLPYFYLDIFNLEIQAALPSKALEWTKIQLFFYFTGINNNVAKNRYTSTNLDMFSLLGATSLEPVPDTVQASCTLAAPDYGHGKRQTVFLPQPTVKTFLYCIQEKKV